MQGKDIHAHREDWGAEETADQALLDPIAQGETLHVPSYLSIVEEDLRVGYRPTVNIAKRLVSIYDCCPLRHEDGHLIEYRFDGAASTNPTDRRGEIDCFLMQAAGTALDALDGTGRKAVLSLPIHFDTLAVRRWRLQVVAILKSLPPIASRRLLLNVEGIEPGTPNSRLRQLFMVVHPLVLGMTWQVPVSWRALQETEAMHVLGLSLHAPTVGDLRDLKDFVLFAHQNGFRVFLRNVRDRQLARMARKLGVDYFNGDSLAQPQINPGRAYLLPFA